MKRRVKVAILFGGKSAEHEVSIQSAKNVYKALDKKKYNVTLVRIDTAGKWYLYPEKQLLESSFSKKTSIRVTGKEISLQKTSIDVVFPVLHGPYGEDGSMQGLLKIIGIPFVGPSVLGSAIGMDKDVSKRLLRDANIPIADFLVFRKGDEIVFNDVSKQLGTPFFVKPANLGSSIGVKKVKKEDQFIDAINQAFLYDNKLIIEKYIDGREIECSVLGNDNPKASMAGEIIPSHEFYDFEAKYIDEKGAVLKIPADLTKHQMQTVKDLAVKSFKILCLEGMARVDMFMTKEGKLYINEINTIPGFTNISMYPKLWEVSGLSYKKLIDNLISLAIERFDKEQMLKNTI